MSCGSGSGPTAGDALRIETRNRGNFQVLERWTADGVATLLSSPAYIRLNRAARILIPLELALLQHCFRLARAERMLQARVLERRRGATWKATRQIELERQRLGRELHTGVGQMLAAVRLQTEVISSQLVDPPAPVRHALERISILMRDALEQVRSISKRLHPPEWQRLGLDTALRQLWQMSGVPQSYDAALHIDLLPAEPDLDVKILIYRAMQEAVSNLIHHSRARRVEARLRVAGPLLVLTVQDDGIGFDTGRLFFTPPSVASGIGLRSIREHAAALGGTLAVQSGPVGTKLEVSVPVSTTQSWQPLAEVRNINQMLGPAE